jgi:2-hydroxyglutarate dehydrogenase
MYLDRLHSDLQEPILNGPSYSPSGEGVPTYFLSPDESKRMEPDLGENVLCSMLSTESGIVDSHALMESLRDELQEERGEGSGSVALGTKVVRIDPGKFLPPV